MATIVIAVCLDPEEDLDVMTEVGVGTSHVSSNRSLVSTTALVSDKTNFSREAFN